MCVKGTKSPAKARCFSRVLLPFIQKKALELAAAFCERYCQTTIFTQKKKCFLYYLPKSRRTSKCGKNISDTLGCASCATFLFLPHFDVICDLLLNRRTATWNLFVIYIYIYIYNRPKNVNQQTEFLWSLHSTPTQHLSQKLLNEIGTFSSQKRDYRSYLTSHL